MRQAWSRYKLEMLLSFFYVVARVPVGSQYLIVYCLWIPKPNPFPLNYTRLSSDFLPVLSPLRSFTAEILMHWLAMSALSLETVLVLKGKT